MSGTGVTLPNGVRLVYESDGPAISDGDAPPVLLLHAWGESLRAFDRVRPLLPSSMTAIALDLRGHGQSDKPANGYRLADFADDVVSFLEALEVKRALLVGASSGGYVAQQVAVTRPDRVAGLVCLASPRSLPQDPPILSEVSTLSDPMDPQWMHRWVHGFTLRHVVPEWYLRDRVTDGLACPAPAFRATLLGLLEAPPPTELGVITTPTTVIGGEVDDVLGGDEAKSLQRAIPGSDLVQYADTGHLVLWERPDRVASDVTTLWQKLSLVG